MSRRPNECYSCRDHGFPNTMVSLAGNDDSGKAIYLEKSGEKRTHKGQGAGGQQKQKQIETAAATGSTTVVSELTQLKTINAKLDRIITMLEEEFKKEAGH